MLEGEVNGVSISLTISKSNFRFVKPTERERHLAKNQRPGTEFSDHRVDRSTPDGQNHSA